MDDAAGDPDDEIRVPGGSDRYLGGRRGPDAERRPIQHLAAGRDPGAANARSGGAPVVPGDEVVRPVPGSDRLLLRADIRRNGQTASVEHLTARVEPRRVDIRRPPHVGTVVFPHRQVLVFAPGDGDIGLVVRAQREDDAVWIEDPAAGGHSCAVDVAALALVRPGDEVVRAVPRHAWPVLIVGRGRDRNAFRVEDDPAAGDPRPVHVVPGARVAPGDEVVRPVRGDRRRPFRSAGCRDRDPFRVEHGPVGRHS